MLEALAKLPQGVLLGLVTWNLGTSLWAWPAPAPAPVGPRRRRFRIIVPAHDEAHVVSTVLADIAALDYPPELVDVWVVADRCADDTALVASNSGARVDERSDGGEGKGAALAWHLERHPAGADTAVVVVDADNRLPVDMLARFADELDAGGHALQGYLDVTNPDESLMATASALTYWAGNRMVQQARRRLDWSADLGGTGMCLTEHALDAAGGFSGGLTEDADLGVRLALAGVPVTWIHDVRIRDEKPAGVGVTLRQRARWMAGKRAVARERVGPLVRQAVADRDPGLFDVALRLVQPGRSFVALASAALAAVAATTGSRWLFAPRVWASAAAVQLLAPVVFLARDGTPPRYLVKYPLVTIVAALWVPVRVASRGVENWYHTPHHGG
ncbi:MAG: glycosyltransferase family 2 protein [Ilumatobacteraceae bacterium]